MLVVLLKVVCDCEMKHRFVQVNVSLGRITCHSAI